MTKRTVALLGLLGFIGSGTLAQAAEGALPPDIAHKRVIGRRPLVVGDLKPASDRDADSLMRYASNDRATLAKCVETGEGVVQWSARGTSLELATSHAAKTTVATAYCDDNIVLLGGSRQEDEDGEPRTWLFYWIRTPGQEFGPVSILASKSHTYKLNELKAIDPVSRQLLFSGTSADGQDVLLAARFAILPRR